MSRAEKECNVWARCASVDRCLQITAGKSWLKSKLGRQSTGDLQAALPGSPACIGSETQHNWRGESGDDFTAICRGEDSPVCQSSTSKKEEKNLQSPLADIPQI